MEKEFVTNPAIRGSDSKQREQFMSGRAGSRAYRRGRAA
jgi:hypothetical protein